MKITSASLALFLRLVDDAPNWSGTPPTDGNVDMTTAERGNLTQLKRAKLLVTFSDEMRMTWVRFTDAGIALAAEHGRAVAKVNTQLHERNGRFSMSATVEIEAVHGVEGDSLYINNYRVAGPKPWGGGKTVNRWTVAEVDFRRSLATILDTTRKAVAK